MQYKINLHVHSKLIDSIMFDGSAQYRSSRPEMLCKKGVLRNFTKFKGKHLCQSLFFNKVAGLRRLLLTVYSIS